MSISTSLLNRASDPKEKSGEWKIHSPAQSDVLLGSALYRYSDIDLAARGANDFPVPADFAERLSALTVLVKHLQSKKQALLETAKTELGRTIDDLEQEWATSLAFLNAAIDHANWNHTSADPRGLTVVLGSYVWPIFYSLHFAILNFLAGNPAVLKPSEKATRTVLALAEVIREVPELKSIQVLVGEKEVGRRMATHELVSTIIFQGSFEVGMRVKQDSLSQPNKEVLLYLGSKNPSIVFGDAKEGIEEILLNDAFFSAGQHCRSISQIFVEKSRLGKFTERFHDLSKAFKIGSPDSGAFMGPLIDSAMLDRFLKFIGISEREGAEIVMRGKPFTQGEKGHYVTPSIAKFDQITVDQLRKSVSLQTEILSPHVSIIGFENEEELKALSQVMTHGRLASIWTADEVRASRLAAEFPAGEVIINASVWHHQGWSTTQARKRSGNQALLGNGLINQLVFQKSIHS